MVLVLRNADNEVLVHTITLVRLRDGVESVDSQAAAADEGARNASSSVGLLTVRMTWWNCSWPLRASDFASAAAVREARAR
jgi:hypothetical protein